MYIQDRLMQYFGTVAISMCKALLHVKGMVAFIHVHIMCMCLMYITVCDNDQNGHFTTKMGVAKLVQYRTIGIVGQHPLIVPGRTLS